MSLAGAQRRAERPATGAVDGLRALGEARFRRSQQAAEAFFAREADAVSQACWAMARRFHRGGRLLAWGAGASASDAWHVAVEFVHPVLVGKRALPALVLDGDPLRRLDLLGRPADILLVLSAGGDGLAAELLQRGKALGLLTVGLAGGAGEDLAAASPDHLFTVPEADPTVVQEVHETLYHVLWELVHVFFDHRGLLVPLSPGGTGGRLGEGGQGGEGLAGLYPFLHDQPADPASVLADVRASTLQKAADVIALRRALWERHAGDLAAAAEILAAAFAAGRKLLAFGNGGSATDAQDLVGDLADPPVAGWRPLPALDLTCDAGVVTAVGNDVRFDEVFSRQVIAFGEPEDVAVGFSTSGESRNVIAALERARALGLRTIGFAGGDGGRMAEAGFLEVAIVAPSANIPRIQEAHATACHALLAMVQALLREEEPA